MKTVFVIAACTLGAFQIVAVSGCKRAERSVPAARSETPAPRTSPIDPRSLHDLAHALAAVEKGDPDLAPEAYDAVVTSYRGKRFRWKLFLIPELCGESQCNARPFKDGGRADGIVAGWMPRLSLTKANRDKLLAECRGIAQCPFTVEATLTEMTANTEEFTSLGLDDVTVLASAPTARESTVKH